MKTLRILFVITIAVMSFTAKSFCQTATSDAAVVGADILTPIAVSKTTDMQFGKIVSSVAGGNVVLGVDNSRTPTGVTLPATTGTVSAAVFHVTGSGDYTYTITLPAAPITLTGPDDKTMTISNFTSNPSGTGQLTDGAQDVAVGAKLNIGANQEAGTYTNNSDFTISVNYN